MMEQLTGHEDIQELLGAYALDAVDPEEAELVSRHLEVCPRCRAEVKEHREVAGLLGYAGMEAPAGLWDRIAASTQEPPPALRLHSVPNGDAAIVGMADGRQSRSARGRGRTLQMRTAAVLGAAAAVVVAVLGVQVARLDHRTSSLSSEVAASVAPAPSMSAVKLALTLPGARRVALAPVSTGESVNAVVLPGGQGYLYDAKLTPLPPSKTYQLWGTSGGQTISYGILGSAPAHVVAFRAGTGVSMLAITAETAGGVEHATHAPVAAGGISPPL